jgi:competence protein ComEA
MDAVRLSRPTVVALLVVLLALLVIAGRRLVDTGAASQPAAAASLRPIAATPAPASLVVVHVVGAVRSPGLYRLRDGTRVADALARAGGATRRADLAAVNLAAPLADGSQIVVPRRAPPGTGATPSASTPSAPAKVSLASATLEQLDALPGVGPVTAQKILDYRQQHGAFRSVDDLDAIPGIGPARVEQLRDLVTP